MVLEFFNELTKENESYEYVKDLNKIKNGKFFLYLDKNKNEVVVKKLNEEEDYEIESEIYSYERLMALDINVPKLLGYNKEKKIVLKEYLKGKDVLGLIRDGSVTDRLYFDLLRYSEALNSDNLNIDYFPDNFILKNEELYYINYNIMPYSETYNLRNRDIFYWLNVEGIKKYMETGNLEEICERDKNIPKITKELEKIRDELYYRYVLWKYEK